MNKNMPISYWERDTAYPSPNAFLFTQTIACYIVDLLAVSILPAK